MTTGNTFVGKTCPGFASLFCCNVDLDLIDLVSLFVFVFFFVVVFDFMFDRSCTILLLIRA